MKELNDSEVSEVSGGILPVVLAIVGIDLALNAVLISYAAYSSANFRAKQ